MQGWCPIRARPRARARRSDIALAGVTTKKKVATATDVISAHRYCVDDRIQRPRQVKATITVSIQYWERVASRGLR